MAGSNSLQQDSNLVVWDYLVIGVYFVSILVIGLVVRHAMQVFHSTVGRVFFPKTSVAIVILFWLKWAGYLAVAGLNLLVQLSDRISPYGV